jgi:hypothetical protein
MLATFGLPEIMGSATGANSAKLDGVTCPVVTRARPGFSRSAAGAIPELDTRANPAADSWAHTIPVACQDRPATRRNESRMRFIDVRFPPLFVDANAVVVKNCGRQCYGMQITVRSS